MARTPLHPGALSFDIEDWFHPELLRGRVDLGRARSVVREGTDAILALLRRCGTPATFFVLGDVVRRHPDLLRAIAQDGHEIASHGMTHRPLWQLDRDAFRAELRGFRAAVKDAIGSDPAVGFRAPTFSLDHSTAWALKVLREEGFRWDSSVFPMRVRLYGVAGAPRGIYRPLGSNLARHDPKGALIEFPVAVGNWGPIPVPVAGGFYLRALPLPVLFATLDRIARRRPFALYLHPWECVRDLPRVALPMADRFVTYCNLETVMPKLERLIERYSFATMSGILERYASLAPAA
jgi:peptidoglycan-N-acetylglucosamine deacetylase